jgi:hypothetical protein
MERVKVANVLFGLFFACGVSSSAQRIGPCPTTPARSPQELKELRGVVVDENSAVVPGVKVRLQMLNGAALRDIAATETGSTGQFSFEPHPRGEYRLIFFGPKGFCPATIPVKYARAGLKGIRLTLPAAATDTCSDYCESRLKIGEMTGREGRD